MDTIDKAIFLKFFNRNGYVFDFSNEQFDTFTKESVGEFLLEKYKLSKGKSLERYSHEASDEKVIKLFSDLLRYYEHTLFDSVNFGTRENRKQFEKCKKVLEKYKSYTVVEIPAIKNIDREYIIDIASRANNDVEKGNFDSAITKSRTLIEETFCFAIEKQNQKPKESGDISKLFEQVKNLYNMHQNSDVDKRINSLLSGLNKIIAAISEMRNKNSDAHGIGEKRIRIKSYHARLFVNSAMVVADFILSVVENKGAVALAADTTGGTNLDPSLE